MEMGHKRQKWQVGDLFAVPLLDGTFAVGHVVGRERKVLNSVTCAFFSTRFKEFRDSMPDPDSLIACLFTTHDLLGRGVWKVVGHAAPEIPYEYMPCEETRSMGWVGARVYGSGNVNEFLNAYHGLTAWDDWADPGYLDGLLISRNKKPAKLLLKPG